MNLPQVITSDQRPASIPCDALVVGAYSGSDGPSFVLDGIDESLMSTLAEALRDSGFKGKAGEVSVISTLERAAARSIAVTGLGSSQEAGPSEIRRAAATAARQLSHRREVVLSLPANVPDEQSAAIEGVILGAYRFGPYKADHQPSMIQRVIAPATPTGSIERAVAIARATVLARDLINEPSSALTPRVLGDRARDIADAAGVACDVLDERALAAQGFGGILGVGKGSAEAPRLIRLHHRPSGGAGQKVALVGKGVTYDSGGLSLKDPRSMETMKTDMSGGAAVIAAMSVLPKLDLGVEVIGYVPAVENMPSGTAVKPGDVITHYGGRTTEVLNTDAEGRLILADALALASEQKPDAIVDIATLTGSISIALGKRVAGLFASDDALRQEILDAGERAGENFWPMPLFSPYKSELKTDIADSKNIGVRYGGAIMAALFLQGFVESNIPWAHLDIAGTARADSAYDEVSKGGTGAATRTLIAWLEGRADERRRR